jgi:chorismate-pyruvate lyase
VEEVGTFEEIAVGELPDHFRPLLAHDDHMSLTVEAWHNSLVNLRVLDVRQEGTHYARQVVLVPQREGKPVLFGIVSIHTAGLPQIVKMEIESQALPLGRIMLRHHLIRDVELDKLWGIAAGPVLRRHLRLPKGTICFGRTARITVNDTNAVELLEIVPP